ncbi:hypothetical protein HY498_02390 [Candidatus Woesearchaeota archaeon]|nr:hypothetical protein [Candidatus Woesearchaeota archaeon]
MNSYRFSSLIIFLIGLFFTINSQSNITGAIIGINIVSSGLNDIIGNFLILIAGILFIIGEGSLEEKIKRKKPANLREAYEMNDLKNYISSKNLIPLTGDTYKKHTQFVGQKISETEFLHDVGKEAQYSFTYDLEKIRDFEKNVIMKANKKRSQGTNNPNKLIVYGISPKSSGITGVYKHKPVFGIAVELLEAPDGIHYHGYPIPKEDIPPKILKKISKRK